MLGVFLLIIAITATPLLSQEVIKFKDVLSEINYSKLLEAEKTAFKESDRQLRAEMLSELATEAHVYNHQLSKNIFLRACLLYTSPSPRDQRGSRMPSSA